MSNPLVTRFLRQTAVWKQRTGGDAYTGATYTTGTTIWVRWFDENQLINTDDETEVLSRAHISAREDLKVGDVIVDASGRDREILTVRLNRDTRGQTSHRVAYLN